MRYETIILEMMSRIQKLENEVKELKDLINGQSTENTHVISVKKNVKVTPEMTALCYTFAKAVYDKDGIDFGCLAEKVAEETGMNYSTAKMNISSIASMLRGEEYNRIISADALDMCMQFIIRDFGKEGLEKAIKATKAHIRYLKSKNMTATKLTEVCNKYEMQL